MPPSGVDYASEFLNGYAPEYVGFNKVMTVDAGTYVMIHSGTKHGIKAVTDCKMITVGCAV